jgi:acetyl-CoA C-acetyltransferase
MNAPLIAWPLGLFDCCPVTDGASAAIMCRVEDAKNFRSDYVTIKGMGVSIGPGQGKVNTSYDFTHWEETERASRQAYEQAGIKNPRKELDLVELHDCFSVAEMIAIESLGLCEKGTIKNDVEAGTFTMEGEIPVNISGGLKSFGHPIGASGCREIYEIYKQIQGKAQEPVRQLKNVQMGLAHNQGGHPGKFQCTVTIVGAP